MAVKPLLTNTYTVLMAAAPPGSDTVIANVCDEPAPEEGVTETTLGASDTVHVPTGCHPLFRPAVSLAYAYTLFAPPNAAWKLSGRFKVN